MEQIHAAITYYIREGFWNTIKTICDQEMKKGVDSTLMFWKAFGEFKEGGVTEAIRHLEFIQMKREIQYAATIALIFYHNQCEIEAVESLSFQASEIERHAPEQALYHCAKFHWALNEPDKAKRLIKQILEKSQDGNINASVLNGWVEITSGNETLKQTSIKNFNINEGEKHLESLMGKAKFFEVTRQFKLSLDVLTDITVMYKHFIPALIEKAKLQMFANDWEQALETTQKALLKDTNNLEALRIWIFLLLSREANIPSALEKIGELLKAFVEKEPKNPELLYNCSQLFARVAGNNEEVLQQTMEMLKRSEFMNSTNSYYISEIAYQKTLLGDYSDAFSLYQKAASLDESNTLPLYGMIYCRIRQDLLDDTDEQLEFLLDVNNSSRSAFHIFLEALLKWKRTNDLTHSVEMLGEALSAHIAETKKVPYGFEFYIKLNSAFLIELAKEYMQHLGMKQIPKKDQVPKYLFKGIKLLETLTRQTPGILESHVLLAKARWAKHDIQGALNSINNCLSMNSESADAYILSGMINNDANNIRAAGSALEQAVAQNFKIRQNPLFLMIKAQVELKNKVFKVANQTISAALELPDVKTKKKQQKGKRKEISSILPFGEEERANLFVMKIEVLNELKMFDEAKKMLHLAVAEFADTPQEVKIILTNSDLAIKSGDIKKAINMLKKIGPDSTHFQQAKIKMGEIYLTHLMDRRHYTKCYMDLIKSNETVENYRLVGDAMMRIQEPEEAIQFYEKALQNSEDSSLVREIGHALVMTHDYKRAIKYYENALDVDPKQMLLREDLTNLYIKLGEYEEAKRILTLAIQILREETSSKTKSNTQPNLKTQCSHVTMLLLLSQVLLDENKSWKLSKNEKAKEFFLHAGELQSQIIEKKREMRSDQIDAEKEVLADINYRLGEYAELRENNMKDAEDYYTEALRAAPANKKALLSLAKLYMRKGEYDQCSHYCQKLLKVDPSNEFSSFMLADIMLIKSNPEQAINCYKNLLANEANNYKALAQLIVLLRRAGRLPDAPAFLEAASKRCPRSIEAGLAYAKGLYCRYTGQAQDALRNFNLGRQDGVFGRDSLINMIELYLNPDDDVLWSTSDQNIKVNEECLGAAESLIKEFKERAPQDPLVGIYEAYSGIFRRQKPIIEKSLGKLSEILQQKKEYVPALVAMSIAKFLMKKQTDARNFLKILQKKPYQTEFAEHFERGWLLLANFYISSKKYDLAEELCQKCLKYNKSQTKAEELMGMVKEQEQIYVEAAQHYEKAWKLSNNSSASIGFRLSFNYLKAKRYVECINICREVLKKFPNYPKIEAEILMKARSSLRI